MKEVNDNRYSYVFVDHRYRSVSCDTLEAVRTAAHAPHRGLDALAHDGVKFVRSIVSAIIPDALTIARQPQQHPKYVVVKAARRYKLSSYS